MWARSQVAQSSTNQKVAHTDIGVHACMWEMPMEAAVQGYRAGHDVQAQEQISEDWREGCLRPQKQVAEFKGA